MSGRASRGPGASAGRTLNWRRRALTCGIIVLGIAGAPLADAFGLQIGQAGLPARVAAAARRAATTPLRMTQAPPPPKPFVSPKAKLRALEVNQKNWDIDVAPEPASAPSTNMVGFREGDPSLLMSMAADEREAGNITGSERLMSIADRMQVIMARSEAKMAAKLELSDTSAATDPDRASAGASAASTAADTAAEEDDAKNWWPYLNKQLVSRGRGIWCVSGEPGPKSARGFESFESGSYVSWKFRIEQLSGSMCIGITSLAVDLDAEWTQDELFNEALFITQNGNLYNGGQMIWESGKKLAAGDELEFALAGQMLYVSVNGEQLSATLGPVVSAMRATVQLTAQDDGVTLLAQTETEAPALGSSAAGAFSADGLSEDGGILTSLFSGEEAGYTPYTPSTASNAEGSDMFFSEFSELSEDEPIDIFALGAAATASSAPVSGWQMQLNEQGQVYYWNPERDTTMTTRPADFVGESEDAFKTRELALRSRVLQQREEQEAAQALDKLIEDTADVFDNNAMALQDSHMTVRKDASGKPVGVGMLVYVDESNCIGCTNCATIARNTFYMHEEHGRARAFRQGGDSDDVIIEAVGTCPVDCIWYVSWDDLVILEEERNYIRINNQARLVGGSNIESTGYFGKGGWGVYANQEMPSKSKASVMNRGGSRCNNCPGRGCYECPLYPVGEHPTVNV